VGLWSVGVNLVLNLVFVMTWPVGYAHAGLALATVMASIFNGVVLGILLQRRIGDPGWGRIARTGMRAMMGSVLMGAMAWYTQGTAEAALLGRGLAPKLAQTVSLGGAIALAMAFYAVWLAITGRDDLRVLLRRRRGTRTAA
jgi:peptidoglycan biosynthesis protein MviN/MurJ (putative lipid II flippase)